MHILQLRRTKEKLRAVKVSQEKFRAQHPVLSLTPERGQTKLCVCCLLFIFLRIQPNHAGVVLDCFLALRSRFARWCRTASSNSLQQSLLAQSIIYRCENKREQNSEPV